jgi:hypothetical protein
MSRSAQDQRNAYNKALFFLWAKQRCRGQALSCFLDEQPLELIPRRVSQGGVEATPGRSLVVNSSFRYEPRGELPPEIRDRPLPMDGLLPGSPLAWIEDFGTGTTLAKTNSIHHQAVKVLGRGLVVEAWSEPDRIVEAIRYTGKAYVFAVQWHPEFHAPDDPSVLDDRPILDEFLAAAAQHKAAAYTI